MAAPKMDLHHQAALPAQRLERAIDLFLQIKECLHGSIGSLGREHRQRRVADELHHPAARALDGGADALVVRIHRGRERLVADAQALRHVTGEIDEHDQQRELGACGNVERRCGHGFLRLASARASDRGSGNVAGPCVRQ